MSQPRLIFVKKGDSSFVKKDEQLLAKNFDLKVLSDYSAKGIKQLWTTLLLVLQLLWYLPRSKYIFIWFADYHSFFPILFSQVFNTRSYIVIGGFETNVIPELSYGVFYKKFRAFFARYSIRHADYLLPVDPSMVEPLQYYAGKIRGKIIPIPTGYDADYWQCDTEKTQQVLSVAIFNDLNRLKLKGLDFYAQVAVLLPEYDFIIAGASPGADRLLYPCPDNLKILGRKSREELKQLYSKSKVYCQFSLSEGLPNVVCEAMLCECIPVGTNIRGIPNAIGAQGYLVETGDIKAAVQAIKKAMTSSPSQGKLARERITKSFTIKKREDHLLAIMPPL